MLPICIHSLTTAPEYHAGRSVAGSALVGNDRYGLAGQRAVRTVRKARQVRTVMSIQNDGTVNDSFGVKATVRKKGFVTKFYSGGRDVTQQVKRGTFRTRTMASGTFSRTQSSVSARS